MANTWGLLRGVSPHTAHCLDENRWSRASWLEFLTAHDVLERARVPELVIQACFADFVLHRRVARTAHPTRRRGHPLPAIATALYYAGPLRAGLQRAVSAGETEPSRLTHSRSQEPVTCKRATSKLVDVFQSMAGDDGDASGGVSLEAWAAELEMVASEAGVDVPLYSPADWYRLANVVLLSLPASVTSAHMGGMSSVHRYSFLDCGHDLDEVCSAALIHGAYAAGSNTLLAALRAPRPAIPMRAMQCPFCQQFGRMTHTELPSLRLSAADYPSTLWILLFRNDPDSHQRLLRHPVDLPLSLGIDGQGALADNQLGTSPVVYDLYAILVYFSKAERGTPDDEFPGDSGGRFSLCVKLAPNDDKFHWIQDDQPALTVDHTHPLLRTHSHAALYCARPPR